MLAEIVIIIGIMLITMFGCGLSKEETIKKALRDRYGEDFNVHEIDCFENSFRAIVSPTNNKGLLFYAEINNDGSGLEDHYYNAYASFLMQKLLKEELKQFFPDSYIRAEINGMHVKNQELDFRNMTIEEILDNSIISDEFGYLGVDIYINEEKGTNKEYEKEYDFFSEKVTNYVNEKKLLPIGVCFWYVQEDSFDRIVQYYEEDIDYDSYFQEQIRGEYKKEIVPFTEKHFTTKEEYIKKREEIEK